MAIRWAVPDSLNRATARLPSFISLATTQRPPADDTTVPCLPSGSWSTAMTSLLSRMSKVDGEALRRSVPMSSGAAMTDQREKCERYSVSDMPPLPTSSMSGSFQ